MNNYVPFSSEEDSQVVNKNKEFLDNVINHLLNGKLPKYPHEHGIPLYDMFTLQSGDAILRMRHDYLAYFLGKFNKLARFQETQMNSVDPHMLPDRIRGPAEYFMVSSRNGDFLFYIGPYGLPVNKLPKEYISYMRKYYIKSNEY